MSEPWTVLQHSPAFGLGLTLFVYVAATRLQRRSGGHPLANPVALSIGTIAAVLTLGGVSYETYFAGAQVIHVVLGPATVALAVPLYTHLARARALAVPLACALLVGCVTAIMSVIGLAHQLHVSPLTQIALSAKSATAPVAIGIAQSMGADPSIAGVFAILTGMLGAMLGPFVLWATGVVEAPAQGFALGLTSHGIGTARALQIGEEAGAFSGLAMGLNAIATTVLLPVIVRVLGLN